MTLRLSEDWLEENIRRQLIREARKFRYVDLLYRKYRDEMEGLEILGAKFGLTPREAYLLARAILNGKIIADRENTYMAFRALIEVNIASLKELKLEIDRGHDKYRGRSR